MKRYRQTHKANSAKYDKMKKKIENRQKKSSKKKKRLNDNRKLLNDRIKWKMQKKNIQESKQKTLWQ